MKPNVVPETPETAKRRRSARRSTMASSMATMALMNQIAATPDSQDCSRSDKKTFIDESPFSRNADTPVASLSRRAAQLGISESPMDGCVEKPAANFHPVFVKPKPLRGRRQSRQDSFEELAPATQDPGENLTPVSKVQAWLNDEQNHDSPVLAKGNKNRRRNSVQGVTKYLLNRSSGGASLQNNSSTDDIESELAKIAEKGESTIKKMFSTASSTSDSKALRAQVDDIIETLEEHDDDVHVPYRPPSFQDYSSDSAKMLLARFESGKGSLTPTCKSSEEPSSPPKVRKTRSLDPPKAQSLDSVLEGVCAFVEVRSKNENRSDVVVDQLVALGATVAPKLGARCTHVIFKEGSLATYTRAKKLGLRIVSVNWILECKKASTKVPEEQFPPMNQEKYESPGLFPRLRKGKSLQPKSDEEFAKLIEVKTKRMFRKRLAENESPLPGTPNLASSISPKIPKRRRSCILDTLKEYEDAERTSPRSPASSCSSEELNTPLLKRIARRLFRAKQDGGSPAQSQQSNDTLPLNHDVSVNELEISNDVPESLSQPPEKSLSSPTIEPSSKAEETNLPSQSQTESPRVRLKHTIEEPKKLHKENASDNSLKVRPSPSSPKRRPRKSMSKQRQATIRKKKLYTQTSVMSETPSGTPENTQQEISGATKATKRGKTKIIKKNSMIIACQPSSSAKENDVSHEKQKVSKDKDTEFKKPLSEKHPNVSQKPSKRIVRSLYQSRRSSADFVSVNDLKKDRRKAALTLLTKELVLTSCSAEDVNLAKKLAKKLPGRAKVTTHVSPSTTHVISGTQRRTLNMLRAILRGCWILSTSWILTSLEADCWVDEEAYELVTFSAAVKARRLERESALSMNSDLLRDIGPIYIGRHCKVPKKDLIDLISLAGGKSVNQVRLAEVILGHDFIDNSVITQVQEKWLLDSIQQHCPLPFADYRLENATID